MIRITTEEGQSVILTREQTARYYRGDGYIISDAVRELRPGTYSIYASDGGPLLDNVEVLSMDEPDSVSADDFVDIRDVIARVEWLESEMTRLSTEHGEDVEDLRDEREPLDSLLSDLRGSGGDHEWRGSWYPATLVSDSYFEVYARDLATDCGMRDPHTWPFNCIDWEKAASQLQQDYSQVAFYGYTYWYR